MAVRSFANRVKQVVNRIENEMIDDLYLFHFKSGDMNVAREMTDKYVDEVLKGHYSPSVIVAALNYEINDISKDMREKRKKDVLRYVSMLDRADAIQAHLQHEIETVEESSD